MRRLLTILLFVASTSIGNSQSKPVPSAGSEQQQPAHSEQPTTANPKPNPAIAEPDNRPCNCKQTKSPSDQSHDWPPPWWSPFWPNYGIIIVGLGAAIAALFTLFTIKEQSATIRATADAAKLQAQAIVNAERPWIFVEESESRKAASSRKARIKIIGVNKGRTPAKITVVDCGFGWFPYGHKYPAEPEYHPVELKYRKYVAPDEPFEIYSFDGSTDVTEEQWDVFSARKERLTLTGRVIYRDVITREKQYETRFCYFLSPVGGVGLIMEGPRSYNQHTEKPCYE